MPQRWPEPVRIFIARPRLVGCVAIGVAAYAALSLWPEPLRASTRAILAWDLGALLYIGLSLAGMIGQDVATMERRSAAQDEGRATILALVLVAAAMSLGAIAIDLSVAKADHGAIRSLRIALVFATVAVSWFLVQLVFAVHYAHEYYERAHTGGADPGLQGGLAFPGGEAPDYWDFLHFALVIGVASQTADISFTSKAMRRLGTVQSVTAFTFNTVVLALTINLLASLFG